MFLSVQEGESSGKRKAEDDDKANKKHKKYVISDEEEEEDDWSTDCECIYVFIVQLVYKYDVNMSYFDWD